MGKKIIAVIAMMLVPCVCFAKTNFSSSENSATTVVSSSLQVDSSTTNINDLIAPEETITKNSTMPSTVQAPAETKTVTETKMPVETKPAQVKEAPLLPAQQKPVPAKIEGKYSGKIFAVVLGDPAAGIKPMVIVEGDNKEHKMFKIDDKTSITQGNKSLKVADLKKDAKVSVDYAMPPEGMTATSIKLQ
jgi:hypothetical protein